MGFQKFAGLALLCMFAAVQVAAQEEGGGNAPQVLTSDLASRQVVEEETVKVTFVLVDTDQITKVTIDGKAEKFTPADFIQIVKTFRFQKGIRTITLEAEDEKGNRRAKKYVVAYGVPLEPEKKADGQKPGLVIKSVVDMRVEYDSNAVMDTCLPGGTGYADFGCRGGDVDPANQEDTRVGLTALMAFSYRSFTGFLGAVAIQYNKETHGGVEPLVIFGGGRYKFAAPNTSGFITGLTLMDINVGGNDYSQNAILTMGYESVSARQDGEYKSLVALELTGKDFPTDDALQPGQQSVDRGQGTLKYNRGFNNKAGDKKSQHVFALGNSTEGAPDRVSDYNFAGYKAAWENRWESGFRMDTGWSTEARSYPNDTDRAGLYNTFRWLFGWHFTRDIFAALDLNFVFNISSGAVYSREIAGLAFKGAF